MLDERYPIEDLRSMLLPRDAWHPYPTIEDREAWDALPDDLRELYLTRAEAALGEPWPVLPATLFLEFARAGNRSRFEREHFARRYRLRDLTLAECMAGSSQSGGRFLDEIVNGIWAICEETYWGVPAHVDAQRAGVGLPDVEEPTVDLFAAETVALLAWVDYLLGERLDAVSPLVRRRIRAEAQRRVLDPCLARDDFWWMGFHPAEHGVNNWNPWVNSNWLTAVLLLEPDPDQRLAAVHKIIQSLDIFIGTYAETGGCDEGPGYWGRAGASLFDGLDLLHSATGGGVDIFDVEKIRNMGRYIYRAHIYEDWFVNFADASAINRPPGSLVYRYGQAIADTAMMAFGAWLMADQAGARGKQEGSLLRLLPALFDIPDPLPVGPVQPLPRDFWFYGIEVMVAREQAGSPAGFFVAAKGGHNAESHNHNDVGNVIVFVDGKPLIVDAGVETYRRQTFSPQRYQIWTMQSAYHTLLPVIDTPEAASLMQLPGEAYTARAVTHRANDARAELILDLAGTYPDEAHLATWVRRTQLQREDVAQVVIEDEFTFTQPAAALTLSLLTPCEVALEPDVVVFKATTFGPEEATRESGAGRLILPAGWEGMTVAVERIAIDDPRLGGVWGDGLNRVVIRIPEPTVRGTLTWRVTR